MFVPPTNDPSTGNKDLSLPLAALPPDLAVVPQLFCFRGAPESRLSLQSPTLVILGGRDVTKKEDAEKLCGSVTRDLEVPAEMSVFSAFYQGAVLEEKYFEAQLEGYYQKGAESSLVCSTTLAARTIVQSYLVPLLPELRNDMDSTERSAALQATASRLSNLTLFGFSLGSIILSAFDRELHSGLTERGYTPEEAAHVRDHLAMLTIGDVAFGGVRNAENDASWAIPSIHVASTLDIFAHPTLSGFIAGEDQTSGAQIRASYVRGRKRIAIVAPLPPQWEHVATASNKPIVSNEVTDPTGHTPPVYIKPKISGKANSLFVPVVVRGLLHVMLDAQQRPGDAAQWLKRCLTSSPLRPYYHERLAELRRSLR